MPSEPLVICTVGLPRSGKSTWVRSYARQHGCAIVSPDAARLAFHGQNYLVQAEPWVWTFCKTWVTADFAAGHEVVLLDATNITRARRQWWVCPGIWKTRFLLFDASKEVCIQRANSSGRPDLIDVIERMSHTQEPLSADEELFHEP